MRAESFAEPDQIKGSGKAENFQFWGSGKGGPGVRACAGRSASGCACVQTRRSPGACELIVVCCFGLEEGPVCPGLPPEPVLSHRGPERGMWELVDYHVCVHVMCNTFENFIQLQADCGVCV